MSPSGLQLPVHLVAGVDDVVVDPKAHSQRLHEALTQSELTLLPSVGHRVHYAAPTLAIIEAMALAASPTPLSLAA